MRVDQGSPDQNVWWTQEPHWGDTELFLEADDNFSLQGSWTSDTHLKGKAISMINSDISPASLSCRKTLTFRQ